MAVERYMISQGTLATYGQQSASKNSEQVMRDALLLSRQTAFLSHSHKDRLLAKGVQGFLRAAGWNVYIDWEDTEMPAKPNRQTASRVKDRIKQLGWFLYLATQNSAVSRWCPWEVGYADGVKQIDRLVIIPTTDGYNTYGAEYLGLYRRISLSSLGDFRVFAPDNSNIPLKDLRP